MKLVVRVKLLPTPEQAAALEATLTACNEAATWAAKIAFEEKVRKPLGLRKHTYLPVRERWGLGAQAAQHAIKKTCDACTALATNLRAGRYGKPGSKRHTRAAGKPLAFRPDAAQPYDDRMLSWQHQDRTVSIWTTAGRMKNLALRLPRTVGPQLHLAAGRRGMTTPEYTLRRLLTEPGVQTVLTAPRDRHELEQHVQWVNRPPLDLG
ncbi:hypothetical protein [Streptomyces sp. NPDC002205]|uniref:hypothetical protein n=1 Tax=Streptomyces sp. NPDC002205 TaxID=3154411 RepID=UPI0033165C28